MAMFVLMECHGDDAKIKSKTLLHLSVYIFSVGGVTGSIDSLKFYFKRNLPDFLCFIAFQEIIELLYVALSTILAIKNFY